MRQTFDIIGHKIGAFTVLDRAEPTDRHQARVEVCCGCDQRRVVRIDHLRDGLLNCRICNPKPRNGVIGPYFRDVAEILAARSEFITECGCQIWMGALNGAGYGQIRHQGKDDGAHRVSWLCHRGPIPAGLWVLHRCDVRPCINPEHLFLGDVVANVADMMRKRRHACFHKN